MDRGGDFYFVTRLFLLVQLTPWKETSISLDINSPFRSGQHNINFVFRESRKDCRHLLVIFTSVRRNMDWLDFDIDGGLLGGNRANILWIHDDVEGQYTYYSHLNRKGSVQDAVAGLIDAVRNALGILAENCTAAGMSKGGSAALLLGIRCNFGNIVALVPQLAIGAYLLQRKRFDIIEHMTGSRDESEAVWLDDLVPNALMQDDSDERNIYIITSPYDVYCVDYLNRVRSRLSRYRNFNLISSSSDLARNHLQTLSYNVPFMVSLLGLLAENLCPEFGVTSNGSGFSGAGHRDNHPLQSMKFGGVLSNASQSNARQSLSRELEIALAKVRSAEARLDAFRSSRFGRLQSSVWRFRRSWKMHLQKDLM